MTELFIALLLLGTLGALVVGVFYAPAWNVAAVLALLAIFTRTEKDNEEMRKSLAALARGGKIG